MISSLEGCKGLGLSMARPVCMARTTAVTVEYVLSLCICVYRGATSGAHTAITMV